MSQANWTEPIGDCPGCGKKSYPSRKTAKAAARRHHPGDRMNAYECHDNPGYWHYGHLRTVVAHGHMPRALLVPGVTVSR